MLIPPSFLVKMFELHISEFRIRQRTARTYTEDALIGVKGLYEIREKEINNMEWIDREEWRRKIKL